MAALVYHWKHGWIPLDHTAAIQKAHGNHDQAIRLLAAAKDGHTGIHTAEHLAHAERDLPNVPKSHRALAVTQLGDAKARFPQKKPTGGSVRVNNLAQYTVPELRNWLSGRGSPEMKAKAVAELRRRGYVQTKSGGWKKG